MGRTYLGDGQLSNKLPSLTHDFVVGLNRTGKSCRLRWVNYLHPGLKRGKMSPQEERLVLELHNKWGNRWSRIARKLPGRTDNEIKNYWRTHMRKKAQEKKRAMSPPLSSSSNSSSSVTNNPTVDSLPFPTGESFYDTGGIVCNMSGSAKEKICTDHEVSMDDIWKDIDLSEEETTVFYDGCINFTCPPLMAAAAATVASPTCWEEYCPEALWMMDDGGVNNTFG